MEDLFSLGHFFTNSPLRALTVALVFIAIGACERWLARYVEGVRPWVQLVPATGWMLFAMNEQSMAAAGATGRFDLAITVPVLALVSAICFASFVAHVRTAMRVRREQEHGQGPNPP